MRASDTAGGEENGRPEMNILVFSVTFDPFVGGAEIALREIAERLPNYRFDLVTLHFDSKLPAHEESGNIRVHRVGFTRAIRSISDTYRLPLSLNKYLFPLFAYRKARALHAERRYDLMWSMMANYAGFAALLFKMRRPSVPFLLTLQEGDPREHIIERVGIFHPLFRRIFASADAVQAISNFLARFAKDMGYPGEPVVVPNGVDTAVFAKECERTVLEDLRRDLKSRMRRSDEASPDEAGEERVVVTASRLVRKNGVADLIAAMRFLPNNVKLVILGDGPDMVMLSSIVSQYGLDSRVVLVGHVDQTDIPKYYRAADVFARPSLSEGFGNAFIEAMAAGLPVVATPVGGIVDFVFDPERSPDKEPTGVFCRPGDPESIAEKIKLVLNDGRLRERLIENGRKTAFEKYDWNMVAERFDREVFAKFKA